MVYYKMGEYLKALSYYENALGIRQQSLPSNHPDLAKSYNNIGLQFIILYCQYITRLQHRQVCSLWKIPDLYTKGPVLEYYSLNEDPNRSHENALRNYQPGYLYSYVLR